MSVLEFRKARESRNVVRTMLGKYLHIVLFTKTRYSSFLNHNFSKISNIKEQILLWGIIGEANFTFLNLKYEEIHISHPSVYFAGFWTQNKQDPVSTMQKTGWTVHSSSWSCLVWKRVSFWIWSTTIIFGMEMNEQTTNQVILVHARSVRRQSFATQHFGIGQTFIWIITGKLLLILKNFKWSYGRPP